jgi:hypothetical protein
MSGDPFSRWAGGRSAGLTQIDFHGLKPAQPHADTTSIFLSPDHAEVWNTRLRQHAHGLDQNVQTEYQWKSAGTSQLSQLAAGYPVGGLVSTGEPCASNIRVRRTETPYSKFFLVGTYSDRT